jgi:hypothetical protein
MLLAHAGFAVLDRERWLLRRRTVPAPARIEEVAEPDGEAGRALSHHRGIPDLRAVQAVLGPERCTLLLQVKKKGEGIAYHQVLHCDDRQMLARHAQAIADGLLAHTAAVLAIDARLLPLRPEGGEVEPIAQPRLFKSRDLRPSDLDNLYNEVLLLDQKLP